MPFRNNMTTKHKTKDHALVFSGTNPRGITKPSTAKPRVKPRASTKASTTTTSKAKAKAADYALEFSTTKSSITKPSVTKPSVTKPRATTTLRDYPLVFSDINPPATTKPITTTAVKDKTVDHPLKFSSTPTTKPRAFKNFQGKAADYPLNFSGTKPRGITKYSTTKPRPRAKSSHADLYNFLATPTKFIKTGIPTKPFAYQSLPPELRLRILQLTLTDPRVIEMHEHYADNDLVGRCKKPNTGEFDFLFQDPYLCVSLLQVNKATYAEARAVLYSENTFRFSSTPIMKRFLNQIGEDNRMGMRRIELVGSILGDRYVSDVARECASEIAKMELKHLLLAIGNIWRCNQWYDEYPRIVEDWMPVLQALWLREKRAGYSDAVVAERVFGVVKLPEARAGQCLTSRLHPGGNGNIWSDQCSTCVTEAIRYPESQTAFKDLIIERIRQAA